MSQNSKLVLKNGILLTIAPFLPNAISIFILPIMTMYLTDVDYGIAGTIAAYSTSISAFATLGLPIVLMNSFFKYPLHYKTYWRQIYGFLKLWMIVYAIIQAVLLYIFIPEEAQENRWLIIFLTNFSTVFFGPTGTIGNLYCLYSKQSVPVVWRSIAASLITLATNFILIVFLRWGYLGWYVGTFAGTFFTNASYWYLVNIKLKMRPIYKFKMKTIRQALNVGVPTIPHSYSGYLMEGSGIMVLDRYGVAQSEIGRLSIAQQLGDMMQLATKGLNDALSPFVFEAIREKNDTTIKRVAFGFAGIVFTVAFLISLWSKEIFSILLSNESLASAYNFFIIYVMSLCYRPVYHFAGGYYVFFEHTKQLLLFTFVSGCIAILSYIVLTPIMGVWGFLLGHYIACLYFGYGGYLFSGYKKHSTVKLPLIQIMLIQIALTGIAYVLVENLLVKIIVTTIISVSALSLFLKYKNVLKNF